MIYYAAQKSNCFLLNFCLWWWAAYPLYEFRTLFYAIFRWEGAFKRIYNPFYESKEAKGLISLSLSFTVAVHNSCDSDRLPKKPYLPLQI